ncbi:MAG: hypothetical protein ACK4TA_24145 [Saprospiraceae bacterium]
MNKKPFSQNQQAEYRFIDRIAFSFAGTDKDALRTGVISQKDEDEQIIFGWAVLIAAVVTCLNVYYLGTYMCKTLGYSEKYAFIPAIVWSAFILINDRALFNDVDIKKLWVRILFLVVSAVVFSYGIQLRVTNAKIEEAIRQDVAEYNLSLEQRVIDTRSTYDEKLKPIDEKLQEFSNLGDAYVISNATIVNDLRRERGVILADKENAVKAMRAGLATMKRQPDYSVYNRIVVYQKHFWLKDIIGMLLGIMILVFEGAPILLRIRNKDSDYLYYNFLKRKMSRSQWRQYTLPQKMKLYHDAERIVNGWYEEEDQEDEDGDEDDKTAGNHPKDKAPDEQPEVFPRFDFDKIKVP